MDYENKYKNAIERARECMKDGGISQNTIDYLCDIFPELKESEDEKIRKDILRYVKTMIGDKPDLKLEGWIAWLEKQNEPKTELVDEDEIYWLAWVIGRLPDTEQANEAEYVLRGLLKKLENMKGGDE